MCGRISHSLWMPMARRQANFSPQVRRHHHHSLPTPEPCRSAASPTRSFTGQAQLCSIPGLGIIIGASCRSFKPTAESPPRRASVSYLSAPYLCETLTPAASVLVWSKGPRRSATLDPLARHPPVGLSARRSFVNIQTGRQRHQRTWSASLARKRRAAYLDPSAGCNRPESTARKARERA